MAITQKLLNLDAYFRSTPGDKIICNDFNYFDIKDVETLTKNLMTVYDCTDVMSVKPACDCGKTHGRYLLGKSCPYCGTTCMDPDQKVTPLLWLKTIDSVHRFINPIVWLMFKRILSNKSTVDYMRYLCDVKYNPPIDIPQHVLGIKDVVLKGDRSYLNVCNNLSNIVLYLSSVTKYKTPEKQDILQLLLSMLNNNQESIFSTYLPIVNKKLFVVENTTKGRYINLASSDIIDVVINWVKLVSEDTNLTSKQISSTIATVMSNLSNLYYNYFNQLLVSKSGIFRKHIYGTRSHFTFRCVIVSRPGEHAYDEIIAPWTIGVTAFRPHLLNKLMKQRGYNYKQANKLLFSSVKKYNPVISELLDELIKESPGGKGIKVTQLRNPSLLIGSSMLMRIVAFKKDTEDYSASVSQLVIKHQGGDFDGI